MLTFSFLLFLEFNRNFCASNDQKKRKKFFFLEHFPATILLILLYFSPWDEGTTPPLSSWGAEWMMCACRIVVRISRHLVGEGKEGNILVHISYSDEGISRKRIKMMRILLTSSNEDFGIHGMMCQSTSTWPPWVNLKKLRIWASQRISILSNISAPCWRPPLLHVLH